MKYLTLAALTITTMIGVAFTASAQTTNSDAPTIQALLAEVRQLRLALEKSALLGPRMQLTMQRLQLQEQKVARLSERLDEARKQTSSAAAQHMKVTEELNEAEQQISSETDAARRKELGATIAHLKKMASDTTAQQSLGARESEIASSLQNERAALNELNDKLNGMERVLDVPQPLIKQP
jgi:chromosome segregation ATPase